MLTELYLSWSLVFLYLPTIIAWIILITYGLVVLQFFLSIMTSIFYIYRKPNVNNGSSKLTLPSVSIVKPLMGVDSCLEENLESHFTLKYDGAYEILFCVEDPSDTSLDVVDRLRKKYPHVDCRVFKGPTQQIVNPMVRNMVQGYDAAKYDLIWICSSRVKVNDDIINDMVIKMTSKPNMELVHQMPYFLDTPPCCVPREPCTPRRQQSPITSPQQSPFLQSYPTPMSPVSPLQISKQFPSNEIPAVKSQATRSCSVGSALEKIYFGTAVPRAYFFLWAIGQTCFTGMSYMFRKSSLDRSGGLSFYGRYLAEDFFIARSLCKLGKQTISTYPALQNVGDTSMVALKDRLVRWMRLRINTIPFPTLYLEPMQECIPCGLAISWALVVHFQMLPYFSFISFFLLHSITWFLLEALLFHAIARCRTSIGFSFGYIFAWILRQLLGLYVYFEAYLNPMTVRWGHGVYRLVFLTGEATVLSRDRPTTPDQI